MTLFAKIVAWFVIAVLVTVAATSVTSVLSYNPASPLSAPFSVLMKMEAADAREAWETGGRDALRRALHRFLDITHYYAVVFADAQGTDLSTGESRRDLLDLARRHPAWHDGQLVFATFSPDRKYCLLLITRPLRVIYANLQPLHLLVLAPVLALCYALAYYLTSPLRPLQRAVEKFGRGDLSARAPAGRNDKFGDVARTFNHMAERMQNLLSAQQRLLLDISHELRSPLARLSVAIELARTGGNSLDQIQKEADRLNELITEMLEVARMENDPAKRKIEAVRLDELVGALVNDCSIEAQVRGCSLELNKSGGVWVEGDRELLRRAIENVMRNAIRYAPAKTRVEVALEDGDGRACVRVRDYGPGVPDSALAHIFDPFYRVETDRNRNNGGYGLGLSIARRAVELHRGKLRAYNASPGLLIEIELPV
ncbi:MAG TPA: ATP-binding protein [Bryobacteraceae bacterium]|nr:ATP-binding protein [Bryobacteraceae bacterium]